MTTRTACGGGCGALSRRFRYEQTTHLLAALLSESVKALAAQLQQLVALGVAQLLPAHQVVGAPLVAGDAVEGKPCPPSA
jgi:hypothetical protein